MIPMAISTFARKEVKFLLNMEQYHALMETLQEYMQPDEYCVGGKEYGIYNIYYDTADDYLIRESLAKPYYKEKLRLRSYYSPASEDNIVFLEIKKKVGDIVTKRRVSMTLGESNEYFRTGKKPEIKTYILGQVFNELDVFLDHYHVMPKHYISYRREAFFGKEDRDFRLTFDRKITERRYDLSLDKESYGGYIIGADQRLMELKVLNAVPGWLISEMSRLGIYNTSFSKYGKAYQGFIQSGLQSKAG